MSIADIKLELSKRWRDDPAVSICSVILDYVASHPTQSQMLTFQSLLNAVGKEQIDDEFLRALTMLVSSRICALDARALLVDEDDSEYEVSSIDLAKARETGELVHPETGVVLRSFEDRLIPFFVPTSRLVEQL